MSMSEKIKIEKKVLSENDRLAGEIRAKLTAGGILALNLVSSPGSGKTSLLERILKDMGDKLRMALVAGDVQTENDAERLARAGGRTEVLVIENVGNLVCPSSYDLGEDMKVVLISTTEGDDKPLKYPSMFRRSSVMIINKIDLLGHSDFDINRVRENARTINADLEIFELSCRTGEGLDAW